MQPAPQPQNALFSQYLKKELGARDIFKAFKILFSSALHALAQGLSFVILAGLISVLSKTVLGEVILPMLGKTLLGVVQNLLPAVLAPYAGELVLGSLALFWATNIFSWQLNKIGAQNKKNAEDTANIRSSVKGTNLLSIAYFVGAWFLPAGLLYLGVSQGMSMQASFTSASWLSAFVGGGVTLVSLGATYAEELSQRVNNRMIADLGLLSEPEKSEAPEIQLFARQQQAPQLQQYVGFLKSASEQERRKKNKNVEELIPDTKFQRQHITPMHKK